MFPRFSISSSDTLPRPAKTKTPLPPGAAVLPPLEPASAVQVDEIQSQYELLAEAIPHLVFIAEPDGEIKYYNKQYSEYTGERSGLYVDEIERAIIHPDDFDECQFRWDESVRTGKPYQFELRLKRAADNTYRWHLARALPLRDATGVVIKWFGTCTDIHDRKMAENEVRTLNMELEKRVHERTRELEASNRELENEILERKRLEEMEHAHLERLRSMIDIMPLGALVTDENKVILHVNERFCQLFEIHDNPASLVGRDMMDIVMAAKQLSQEPDFYMRRINATIESRKTQLEEEVPLKNGRILLRDYLPIFANGNPRGHLFLYRDVTQERRVDAAKSEFMSLASHQLRTPLTSVRWAMGRLQRQLADRMSEAEQRLLHSARMAVAHMASTIDTMLTISRLEAGKVHLKEAEVSLHDLLRQLKDQHADTAGKRGITLVADIVPATLQSDGQLLKEVLLNLLSNSLKYTPAGGRVAIRSRKERDAVIVDVEDSGYGIPLHQQKKIFTKFFRGENILRRNTDGTGLGLYLSYRLVHLLGGTLTFVSQENKGTTFTVILPAGNTAIDV